MVEAFDRHLRRVEPMHLTGVRVLVGDHGEHIGLGPRHHSRACLGLRYDEQPTRPSPCGVLHEGTRGAGDGIRQELLST